jgi:hypothetical protein
LSDRAEAMIRTIIPPAQLASVVDNIGRKSQSNLAASGH